MLVHQMQVATHKGSGQRDSGRTGSPCGCGWSWLALALVVLGLSFALPAAEAAAQTYPRCISGCTANDIRVTSVYLGNVASCTGGRQTADLYVALEGNREYHCVMLVVDVWVNGRLQQQNLTSTVTAEWSGGAASFRVGAIAWPCNQSVEIRNIYVQWSPNAGCTSGDCAPYNAPSKCIDSYPNVVVAAGNAPPMALDDRASVNENESVRVDVLANDADGDGTLNRSTVTIVQAPAFGSTSVDPATGTVTYAPALGTCGEDSFRYTVCDDDGAVSAEATVTIGVACNQSPVAVDDSATTDERTAIAINVVANDHDSDGVLDLGSVVITQNPGFGSLSVHSGTGIVTYTPAVGACGDDVFAYTVRDDDGATSNPARVTVGVLCNDPPIAVDDLYNVAEGGTLGLPARGVLVNDQATPGMPLMAVLVTGARHGALTLNSDGSFVYVHDGTETLDDSFTYKANDSRKDSNVATVSFVISPTNDAPSAAADEATTEEDTPVRIDVLANDSDPDGDALTVDVASTPANGRVSNLGGSVQYAPNPDYSGVDNFTYTASDGHGGTAVATVTITVTPVNDAPVAQNDSASTNEDVPVTVLILANDRDVDGDALAIQSVTQPMQGAVAIDGSAAVYTPSENFNGIDAFTYTVTDGRGGTATATVTITVAPVNDPPLAQNDSASTDEDVAVTVSVLANDSDVDGDALAIQSVTQPGHGVVTSDGSLATYAPSRDWNGIDTFTYTVVDEHGGTATGTVTVTVAPVNDAPVAQNDSASTDEDVAVMIAVLGNDSDSDGDVLAIQSVSAPTRGAVEIAGSALRYAPTAGFHGIDGFTYMVADGQGGTGTATVTVSVATANHAPVARGGSVTTDEDVPLTIAVLANDSDPDGDPLVLESVTQPSNGFVTTSGANATYTPSRDWNGIDAFTYTVADGRGGTATATITVTVTAMVAPPLASADSASTNEGVPVTVSVLANDSDPDGGSLTLESVSSPANGTAQIIASAVLYTPAAGFHGLDSFAYVATNAEGRSASALVTIDVVSVNAPPVAVDDSASTLENAPVSIAVLANDSDPDGDLPAVESISQPAHGTTILAGSSIVYTPALNYHGDDVFTYMAVDGRGGTCAATVRLTVVAVNHPPVAQDDNAMTNEDVPVTIAVLGNDRDPDGNALTIQAVSPPAHGTVSNGGTGVTYTPSGGFSGTDSFTYTVADGQGGADAARVSVAVTHVNHAPIAQDDSASTSPGSMLTIAVLENDSDPDGDFLLVQSVESPAHGTVLNGSTAISYISDVGFQGVDKFSYIVSDGNGGSAAATVTVAVALPNQAPVARDDSAVTNEDTPAVVSVLANDLDPDGDALRMESVGRPLRGSAVRNGAAVMYTPAPGWSGVDVFSYTVSDGRGGTAAASVTIVVLAVNHAPAAQDDSAMTSMDVPVSIAVLENDSDQDGDVFAIESVSHGLHGTVAAEGSGVVYTPEAGFVGTDSFTYTVRDTQGLSATATVTVGVEGVAGGGGAAGGSCDGKVIISEVAWAGTAANAGDEWIELRNLGTTPIDLAGWTLQWRRTRPVTAEDSGWKVIELSGVVTAADASACDAEVQGTMPGVAVSRVDSSGLLWQVTYNPDAHVGGYFLLERSREDDVRDVPADMVYDPTRSPVFALSDLGEVIMLVDASGNVVDTANASSVGTDEWAAGSTSTSASMERVDPLGLDTAGNWSTNMGVVARGVDAQKHPLHATPGAPNSPRLDALYQETGGATVALDAGAPLEVSFSLTRADRLATGWPWIVTSRPGVNLAAGGGGNLDPSTVSLAGRSKPGEDTYVLDIDTARAAPGVHLLWVVYGKGQALLMPVLITP